MKWAPLSPTWTKKQNKTEEKRDVLCCVVFLQSCTRARGSGFDDGFNYIRKKKKKSPKLHQIVVHVFYFFVCVFVAQSNTNFSNAVKWTGGDKFIEFFCVTNRTTNIIMGKS